MKSNILTPEKLKKIRTRFRRVPTTRKSPEPRWIREGDTKPTPKNFWRIWPIIFWRECVCCGKDFRRVRGWRCLGKSGSELYLCNVCGPTKEVASSYFLRDIPRFDIFFRGPNSEKRLGMK